MRKVLKEKSQLIIISSLPSPCLSSPLSALTISVSLIFFPLPPFFSFFYSTLFPPPPPTLLYFFPSPTTFILATFLSVLFPFLSRSVLPSLLYSCLPRSLPFSLPLPGNMCRWRARRLLQGGLWWPAAHGKLRSQLRGGHSEQRPHDLRRPPDPGHLHQRPLLPFMDLGPPAALAYTGGQILKE